MAQLFLLVGPNAQLTGDDDDRSIGSDIAQEAMEDCCVHVGIHHCKVFCRIRLTQVADLAKRREWTPGLEYD